MDQEPPAIATAAAADPAGRGKRGRGQRGGKAATTHTPPTLSRKRSRDEAGDAALESMHGRLTRSSSKMTDAEEQVWCRCALFLH